MTHGDAHISDSDLLLHIERELPSSSAKRVLAHIAGCWKCRTRRHELETAITGFVRIYQSEMDLGLPPAAGPRALLKARLAQISSSSVDNSSGPLRFRMRLCLGIGLVGIVALGLVMFSLSTGRANRSGQTAGIVSVPDSRFTPGATLLLSRSAVCSQASSNNRKVSPAIQRKVLEEYGVAGA